jgi:hypothetical protein
MVDAPASAHSGGVNPADGLAALVVGVLAVLLLLEETW